MESLESYFVFYLGKHIRYYREYTSSIHEGANKEIKYNAAPVTPGARLDHSLVILSKNAICSTKRKSNKSIYYFCSMLPHAKNQCVNDLIDNTAYSLQSNFDNLKILKCLHISKHHWLVKKRNMSSKQLFQYFHVFEQ